MANEAILKLKSTVFSR